MTPEEIVREELRSVREIGLKLAQWGVTTLAALQMILYYVRKDVYLRLLESKAIQTGDLLPGEYYYFGTGFLFVVATIFTIFLFLVGDSYRYYRNLLETKIQVTVPVPPRPLTRAPRWLFLLTFYVFPVMDIVIRGLVHITVQ
jgi:Ni,Fe-hydrogenase I cytochrome b subunit